MKTVLVFFFIALPAIAFSQVGVSFHQSNLPFVGVNYEIKDRFRPEARIGVDNYFEELSLEGVVTYDFLKKEDYEFYGGVGGRVNSLDGLVIPAGVNIFPLGNKQFGFHLEAAALLGENSILRGSWGIRYRFSGRKYDSRR